MNDRMKTWALVVVSNVAVALAVFVVTRDYYLSRQPAAVEAPSVTEHRAEDDWSGRALQLAPALLNPGATDPDSMQDPVRISDLANESFAAKDYRNAAGLYERLLDFDPQNVDVLNNLGLTLHYLGRSAEAIERLEQGRDIDPTNQRLWLTLGFVNSQLGNVADARAALTTAARMDQSSDVGRSAQRMLDEMQ